MIALALMLLLQSTPAPQKAAELPYVMPDSFWSYAKEHPDANLVIAHEPDGTTITVKMDGRIIRTFPPPAPPDFTVSPCDITTLSGDCGDLFDTYWYSGVGGYISCGDEGTCPAVAPLLPCSGSTSDNDGCVPDHYYYLGETNQASCKAGEMTKYERYFGTTCHIYEIPLAKSMADQGWSCKMSESHIECTKGDK